MTGRRRGPARLPKRKGSPGRSKDHLQDTPRTIGVSAEAPSPAWLRMVERKGRGAERTETVHRREDGPGMPGRGWPRPEPGQGKLFSVADKPLHPIEERLRDGHISRGCPYCITPGFIQANGWPARCKVRVSGNVECADTASAERIGHHHDCVFWDHTDGVPF